MGSAGTSAGDGLPVTDESHDLAPAVIGTAGHVDHGKSTLVRALTGIDPDRLAEEKARSMTIDLGFAWLELPGGRRVSLVDVPGHERFIKNMLAGVGGIDAALFVVAADEGPMPQTLEHLAILDLLGIERGVVALTKADTVEADWLDLVTEEVRERLAGSVLATAAILPVSALTGHGLPDLTAALAAALADLPPRIGGGKPRLPIDRVFTVAGFGTVVTGTLTGGELTVGQELRVEPRGLATRVRGLQSHQVKTERALPGSRVAVNLGGIAVEDIHRGDVLVPPGLLRPTQRMDARLNLLADSPVKLEQNDEVDLFAGAAELPARITLLDRESLQPGDSGWVQFRFRSPLAVLKGDRFIVRRPSPSQTIGGGAVVDPNPPRHKRFRSETLSALETLAQGSPDELVLQALDAGPREVRELRAVVPGLSPEQVDEGLAQLVAEGDAIVLGGVGAAIRPAAWVASTASWDGLAARLGETLAAFHQAQPLRRGMAREEVRSRLRIAPPRLFDEAVAAAGDRGVLRDDGATLRLPGFRIELDATRRSAADAFLAAARAAPFSPPPPSEFGLDADTIGALESEGEVVRVAEGMLYAPEAWDAVVAGVLDAIEQDNSITMAAYRDRFATSRKYAQPALEYLDQLRITRRVGDERVRGSAAPRKETSEP